MLLIFCYAIFDIHIFYWNSAFLVVSILFSSLVNSFFCLFLHSFLHSFVCSFVRSFVCSLVSEIFMGQYPLIPRWRIFTIECEIEPSEYSLPLFFLPDAIPVTTIFISPLLFILHTWPNKEGVLFFIRWRSRLLGLVLCKIISFLI